MSCTWEVQMGKTQEIPMERNNDVHLKDYKEVYHRDTDACYRTVRTAMIQNLPRYPSTDECMKNCALYTQ